VAVARRPRKAAAKKQPAKLSQRLVLNDWLLRRLFQVEKGEALLAHLAGAVDAAGVGADWVDSEGVSWFHRRLTSQAEREHLTHADLRRYDENIVRHWREMTAPTERRGYTLQHFQYAALLFTEVYLDRYFRDEAKLLADLNAWVDEWNWGRDAVDQAEQFAREDLNKLAFWMATGSGKTLLMHVNIKQYLHYLDASGRRHELNRILLLTPNEGLSRQHLEEFHASGMQAELFLKEGRTLFTGNAIEIIDIHKLAEESREKTVAVDAFEGNNLVLVDEGHRGSSSGGGGIWMDRRRRLCEDGFSFEYSATFGQAIKAGSSSASRDLVQEYGHAILFDYSYRYFHTDGFGKDYQILNLKEDQSEEQRLTYMTGALLAFLQQLRVHRDDRDAIAPYLVEKPLWVFVGHTVQSTGTREVSDIVDVLKSLAEFVSADRETHRRVLARIERLRDGKHGLLDRGERDIFANRLRVVLPPGRDAADVYSEALKLIFNAPQSGTLQIEQIRGEGAEGEIALRVGGAPAFGVINVGEPSKVVAQAEKQGAEFGITSQETGDFKASLFRSINSGDSPVNVLIGAKKFTEGWSSWRVSTMGLMNVGKSEGSEIIQLFGRGVRLKGLGHSLKRSGVLPASADRPQHLPLLETLNIFGVRADYMDQFRDYLTEEGLPPDDDFEEVRLRVIHHLAKDGKFEGLKLKTLALPSDVNFKTTGPKPILTADLDGDDLLQTLLKRKVVVDWYPRVQSRLSKGAQGPDIGTVHKQPRILTTEHLAFFDWNAIWFALQRFKAEKSWHNLAIPREVPPALLERADWYELLIPESDLAFDSFERVREWQEIAVALLKKFVERYYNLRKNQYEAPFLRLDDLDFNEDGTGNFFAEYVFQVPRGDRQLCDTLDLIAADVEAGGDVAPRSVGALEALTFDGHLYTPLIRLADGARAEVRPSGLDQGERDFVHDLARFLEENPEDFTGREVYLLRNRSRGRGVGFFEGAGVYPDFILWVLDGTRQHITFVDPHGLVHASKDDPKLTLARTIKDHQARVRETNPEITIDSFLISRSERLQASWASDLTEADLREAHVLFPERGSIDHIRSMFKLMEAETEVAS